MKRILVLGSLNIDLVTQVPRIPLPGETLQGGDLQLFVGGKGANQACAAALLGGCVAMAGKVGNDVFAARLIGQLQSSGVVTDSIEQASSPSGTAMILVLPHGENVIVISPGANGEVSTEFARKAVESLSPGDLLLCQLEIPLEAVHAALAIASEREVITILDPAPARALSDELLSLVHILTPNQTEAAVLLDASEPPDEYPQAQNTAHRLLSRGPKMVILKMGSHGCFLASSNQSFATPGFEVQALDTTAAGDTFNGALAAALARAETVSDALVFANAAAALSVTKPGAIASIPSLQEVNDFLALRALPS